MPFQLSSVLSHSQQPYLSRVHLSIHVAVFFRFLTMQATREKPMINIAKVSDWLTRNANEQLYPRLL
jgi:hypothetical protein